MCPVTRGVNVGQIFLRHEKEHEILHRYTKFQSSTLNSFDLFLRFPTLVGILLFLFRFVFTSLLLLFLLFFFPSANFYSTLNSSETTGPIDCETFTYEAYYMWSMRQSSFVKPSIVSRIWSLDPLLMFSD